MVQPTRKSSTMPCIYHGHLSQAVLTNYKPGQNTQYLKFSPAVPLVTKTGSLALIRLALTATMFIVYSFSKFASMPKKGSNFGTTCKDNGRSLCHARLSSLDVRYLEPITKLIARIIWYWKERHSLSLYLPSTPSSQPFEAHDRLERYNRA